MTRKEIELIAADIAADWWSDGGVYGPYTDFAVEVTIRSFIRYRRQLLEAFGDASQDLVDELFLKEHHE